MTSPSANQPQRLVLDTNVWLDLLVFDDPRCAALRSRVSSGVAIAYTRADCREEWLRVLGYPALSLDTPAVAQLVVEFDTLATLWSPPIEQAVQSSLPRCRDPDDQKFLELARDVGASVLLTRDDALLRLSRRCAREGLFAVMRPEDWVADAGASYRQHPSGGSCQT